jgi:MFS family permease
MDQLEKTGQKITWALLGSQSLFSAAMIISFTVSGIIVVELAEGNKQWAGVPGTVLLIGAAGAAYVMGRFMDRFGRRPGLTLGYLFGIGAALLAAWAVINQSLTLYLLSIIGMGLNRGTNDLGRYAAAEANPVHKRARALSLVVLGGTFGSIFGPLLVDWAGQMAERYGLPVFSGPWLVAGIFLALALILINLLLHPDPQAIGRELAALEPETPVDQARRRPYREIFTDPRTKIATGAMICGQLAMVTVMTITPVHMHGHQHSLASISWVIMAHTLGMFGLSFMTGWLVDRWGQPRIIMLGGLMLVAACGLAPLWDNVLWLAVALFLLGLGWNFCFVAGSALLTAVLRPGEKGRTQGLTDALVYIASGVGSLGSGLIFAALGFWVMSWLSILIALVPVLLVILLPLRAQTSPALEEAASS